jgi:galactokinase
VTDGVAGDRTAALMGRATATGRAEWGDGWMPARAVFAPGRLELLGNHLDYNGGRVLAGAIDRGIMVVSGSVDGDAVEIALVEPDGDRRLTERLDPGGLRDWSRDSPPESPVDYVRGAIAAIHADGMEPRGGLRLALAGDVPVGLGVSSSAALCVAVVSQLLPGPVAPERWVLLAQAAENRAGVACGTMDQAASVAGGVIRFDAATLAMEPLAPDLGDHAFIVVSSGVTHRLGESAYPVRVREMRRLGELLHERLGDDAPASVADVTEEQIRAVEAAGPLDETLRGRVRHLVTESARVRDGYDGRQDWVAFGWLMSDSGRSSATDYDVSHPQVEELVAVLREQGGVLGARMMGGGGGGSVLALVRSDAVERVERAADDRYFIPHGMADLPDRFLVCRFGPGARDVPIDA